MSFAAGPTLRAAIVVLALLALLAAPRRSSAQELHVVARASGGYDSNPTLAAPENRRGPTAAIVSPDGFGRAELSISGALGDTPWAGASLDADARVYGNGEVRAWERVGVSAGTRAGRFAPALRLEGSRYDASGTEDAAWTGRARLGLGADLADGLVLDADALGGLRAYDTGGQADTLVGGGLALTATAGTVRLAGGVGLERRFSTDVIARRLEVAPWVSLRWTIGPVDVGLQYSIFIRFFDDERRDGIEHGAGLTASAAIAHWLRLLASVDVGVARGETEALVYERVEALGGLEIAWDAVASTAVVPDPAPGTGPATPARDGIRFRVRLTGARDVRVVGTLNDWDPDRGRLRPIGQDVFEAVLPAVPGHHRYHLLVDGEPRRPEGADRYVRDDLGGEDAVITVGREDSDGAEVVQQPP